MFRQCIASAALRRIRGVGECGGRRSSTAVAEGKAVRDGKDLPTAASSAGERRLLPSGPLIADTMRMVRVLENSGFSTRQAETLSDAMVGVSTESMRANRDFLATKVDFHDLKSELQILEKADFAVLKSDLQILERKMETKIAAIYTEMERIENRVIKWVIGAAGTVFAVVLGFLRVSSSVSAQTSSGSASLSDSKANPKAERSPPRS